MSAGFTPGPWAIHASNRVIVRADGAFNEITVKDGKVDGDDLPYSICLLRDPDEDFSEDETLANGFLIAAAPALYAELMAARGGLQSANMLIEGLTGRGSIAIDTNIERIDATLKQARGEV